MKCALCRKPTERSLCATCWDYALDKLQGFPGKYNELAKELIPSQGRNERVGGSKTPPIPVRLETLHLRSGGISKPLMAHEEQIRAQQRHTRITFRGQEFNRIVMTCKYLTAQSQWIYEHYNEALDLAFDINKISKRINAVLGFKSDLITIGTCPSQDEDGQECGANLQINPSSLTSFGDIRCKSCGSVWPSEKWRLLGRMLNDNH
jgi:hypothetical protein